MDKKELLNVSSGFLLLNYYIHFSDFLFSDKGAESFSNCVNPFSLHSLILFRFHNPFTLLHSCHGCQKLYLLSSVS